MPAGDTDLDEFFDHGVSDGLPVVPPTRARVSRAVERTGRDGSELVAEVPPNYGRATVEKIAVNAAMTTGRYSGRSTPSAIPRSTCMAFPQRPTRDRRWR